MKIKRIAKPKFNVGDVVAWRHQKRGIIRRAGFLAEMYESYPEHFPMVIDSPNQWCYLVGWQDPETYECISFSGVFDCDPNLWSVENA